MPVARVGPDSNGLYYNAVSTAEWQGSYGQQLRAAGWTYCGYGTWGVYVAPPGGPCSSTSPSGPSQPPGPQILPPAPADTPVGNASAPVTSCCRQVVVRPQVGGVIPSGQPAPAATETVTTDLALDLSGVPRWLWWLILLLVILVLVRR